MTVEESQISPAGSASAATSNSASGAKAKMVNASPNTSAIPMEGAASFAENIDTNSFEALVQTNPSKADELLNKLTEVTGVTDRPTLYKAFNQSRKSDQRREFNVTHAIELLLQLSEYSASAMPAPQGPPAPAMEHQQRVKQKTPLQEFAAPASAINSNVSHTQNFAPPNSPTPGGGTGIGGNGDLVEPAAEAKPLVDLTGPGNNPQANQNVDADLEKAIQLSLQEAKRSGGESFGVTKEEEDVSRALEASLMENQFGPKGPRGLMVEYIDPLNPHDRERRGMVSWDFCYENSHALIYLFRLFSGPLD